MSYPHSMVVITPAWLKPQALSLGRAYGVESGFDVPLSPDGLEPVTHYGLHTWASVEFAAILSGQVIPQVDGYTEEQITGLLAQMTVSIDKDGLKNRPHFDSVLADVGLQVIDPLA